MTKNTEITAQNFLQNLITRILDELAEKGRITINLESEVNRAVKEVERSLRFIAKTRLISGLGQEIEKIRKKFEAKKEIETEDTE